MSEVALAGVGPRVERLWLITNPRSGSASAELDAVLAVVAEAGLTVAGRTDFPDDGLPTPNALTKAGVDTVVLLAGDGTINAAVTALGGWDGTILILPGGTMNLLAKSLHGDADPVAILGAAQGRGRRVALPFVAADGHRALVGLIVGPAANWYRARERLRKRRLRDLWPAVRAAWRRTFGGGVRLADATGFPREAQAAFVSPDGDGLSVVAIDARDFPSIADLGWNIIAGDWVAAHAVTEIRAPRLTLAERRPTLALVDGEPVMLAPGTVITAGRTAARFLATT